MRLFTCAAFTIGAIAVAFTARSEPEPLPANVSPGNVICRQFLGFGAEWDTFGYPGLGITDQDYALIRKRVEWMRLPVARIMMLSKWCYKGGGKFDWGNPEMKALYRQLDVCQKVGTTVFLTDWGVEPDWLRMPDVVSVTDARYAEVIGTYLDQLLNRRGYTCIQHFIMVNEPNYEVKDWGRWKQGVESVAAELRRRGLDKKLKFTGSDQSNADDWHRMAVDQLQGTLGAYDLHRYASPEDVRAGRLQGYFHGNWQYALGKDPNAGEKPMVVGEAGFWVPGTATGHNPLHLDYQYGVLMADYAVQAANAGSWAVSAWMLDDSSLPRFTWGMWQNRAAGMKLKPWFYTWSLLCRLFPRGSGLRLADILQNLSVVYSPLRPTSCLRSPRPRSPGVCEAREPPRCYPPPALSAGGTRRRP